MMWHCVVIVHTGNLALLGALDLMTSFVQLHPKYLHPVYKCLWLHPDITLEQYLGFSQNNPSFCSTCCGTYFYGALIWSFSLTGSLGPGE